MSESVKLYGLWHPERGWQLDGFGIILNSPHVGVMRAQLSAMIQKRWQESENLEVRIIGKRGKPLAQRKAEDACETEDGVV